VNCEVAAAAGIHSSGAIGVDGPGHARLRPVTVRKTGVPKHQKNPDSGADARADTDV